MKEQSKMMVVAYNNKLNPAFDGADLEHIFRLIEIVLKNELECTHKASEPCSVIHKIHSS